MRASEGLLRFLPVPATLAMVGGLLILPVTGADGVAVATDTPQRVTSPRSTRIDWRACSADASFDCGQLRVPMDYRRPSGRHIRLAVVRKKAGDPTRRIGSLFFNPGGPGGPGVAALMGLADRFPHRLAERFDLVSWDPRGVGDSTAVQCFANPQAEDRFFAHVSKNPVGDRQRNALISAYEVFGSKCASRNGTLLQHLSTADSARDLDALRAAVGDRRLNYLGVSYGTFLGATYANLFPNGMRAMTLDGNVRPKAWVRQSSDELGTFMRQNSDLGAEKTMTAFLNRCGRVGPSRCDFSAGDPSTTRAKFADLINRMKRHSLRSRGGYTYATLLDETANATYFTIQWPGLGRLLQNVWLDRPTTQVSAQRYEKYAALEQALGILCPESPNPSASTFGAQARLALRRSGLLGSYWAWTPGACPAWRATPADPYTGPWDTRTRRPILLIGNTYDPATPLSSSKVMQKTLARARLLTVEGYGHTALLNPSACANRLESRYFIRSTLPRAGTRCPQDGVLFPR